MPRFGWCVPGAPGVILAIAAAACGQAAPHDAAPAPADSPTVVTEKWRAKHETDYRRDWVSIAGLFSFKAGVNTAGSAKANDIVLPASTPALVGRFILAGHQVRFEPDPGAAVLRKGQPVTAAVDLEDDSAPGEDELTIGDVRLTVHASGEHLGLRVRDPNGPLARGFLGFNWFPIDLQYRVTGRFIKDADPKPMKVVNTFGDLDEYKTEGVVEFTLMGQTVRLRPFTTRPNRFYFVFRDASSGQETYETARFLYADLLADGTTVLDFNQAYNPPCAFNPYTTCPIPLRENHLPVKVLAGEKAYPAHVPLGRPGGGGRP
ncbi:MAG TPA: DUF1684 domain-containing protein [Vicinamibacterales bacterium]|nr:DUF1684 domain-containing protein [Vicinamibacterales bacterium]